MREIFDMFGRFVEYVAEPTLSIPKSEAAEHIKLAHSSDVEKWERIPSYEEFNGCSLAEYHDRRAEISRLSDEIKDLVKSYNRKQELHTEDHVEYQAVDIKVPRGILGRNHVVMIPEPMHASTAVHASEGRIEGNQLIVRKTLRRQHIKLTYSCPSSEAHADEIREIDRELRAAPESNKRKLNECLNSTYTQPILFISHRWEDPTHPDPTGTQIKKLARLQDCFFIYDYTSFPQDKRTESAREALEIILKDMTSLICNVIALSSDKYIERGWCFYEYIIATMKEQLVCDEIGVPDFVELRNLVSTRIPPSFNLKGDTIESWLHNAKGRRIVEKINAILPNFLDSRFTIEEDRTLVKELLVDGLLGVLPTKQTHTPYVGWQPRNWEREEVERAFEEPIEPEFGHSPIQFDPTELAVFNAVDSAVAAKYQIPRQPLPTSKEALEFRRWEMMGGRRKSE